MKFLHLLFFLLLLSLSLSLRNNNLKTRKTSDDPPSDSAASSSESSSSSEASTAATSDAPPSTADSGPAPNEDSTDSTPAAFLSVMKDKSWVYSGNCPEKPKKFSQMTNIPGNANQRVQKKDALNKKIFSNGYALLCSTVLSNFLAANFKSEVQQAFSAFANGATELQVPQIKKGMSTNKWLLQGSLDDMSEFMFGAYNVDGSEGLSEREFAYMAIDNTFSYAVTYGCQNCLAKTRWEADQLFTFMDYDTNGYVQAEDIYEVFRHLKGGEELKTTNANEWLLKEDIRGIGRLGRAQFTEAVMKSLYEHEFL